MAKILVDMLQGGHYSFLEELPERKPYLEAMQEMYKPKILYK